MLILGQPPNNFLDNFMAVCQVCGNDISACSLNCRFCGSKQDSDHLNQKRRLVQKTVNLELGHPPLEVALQKLDDAIKDAAKNSVVMLTLIHGYGSSGKGGRIRLECRKKLEFMKSKSQIHDYIAGEDFSRKFGPVKMLLQRYPQLSGDSNFNKGNRGITLVVI
jgi:hypothetical protein